MKIKNRSRTLRRLEKGYHRKRALKGNYYEPMEDKSEEAIKLCNDQGISTKYVRRFLNNDRLSIQEFELDDIFILGFRNNTTDKDIPWMVKQYWKNKLGYQDMFAFEAFPSQDDLINQANMYWLMIPKEPIPFLSIKNRVFHPKRGDKIE